jgi:hypothetical protein
LDEARLSWEGMDGMAQDWMIQHRRVTMVVLEECGKERT